MLNLNQGEKTMYPVECYDAQNQDKLEAVRYYVELNKAYLKEVSKEEYETFVEYMKGTGKDVLIKISSANSNEELNVLVEKIDINLPYGKILKGKTFEEKLQAIYRQFAKNMKAEEYSAKTSLKKQRELATLYDKTNDVCNAYKNAVNEQRYIKEAMNNRLGLLRMYFSKEQSPEEFKRNVTTLAEQTTAKTKEARKAAFALLMEYNIKDEAYRLLQQNNESQK